MGRPQRNDSHDGWFHVSNRGARRYDIFVDDDDRFAFLEILGKHAGKQGVDVIAYCLMSNHYHLILNCPSGNLSTTMRLVGASYTRLFNRSHGFDGSLFGKRFHSETIESDKYLLAATRYVHRNPLEVGWDIDTYQWSSHPQYLSPSTLGASGIKLDTEVVLDLAGGADTYKTFVDCDLPTDEFERSRGAMKPETYPRRSAPSLVQIDEAIRRASLNYPAAATPARRAACNRQLAILLAADGGAHSIAEITAHYRLPSQKSTYSVLRRARHRVESDPYAAEVVSESSSALHHY